MSVWCILIFELALRCCFKLLVALSPCSIIMYVPVTVVAQPHGETIGIRPFSVCGAVYAVMPFQIVWTAADHAAVILRVNDD